MPTQLLAYVRALDSNGRFLHLTGLRSDTKGHRLGLHSPDIFEGAGVAGGLSLHCLPVWKAW